jgi:Xaa-Pro aminopeptidase
MRSTNFGTREWIELEYESCGGRNSHRNPVIYCGESDFAFEDGDIVRTDYLAYVNGYPGHQSRNAVIGKPSAQQVSDYAKYHAIYQTAADRLRPGIAVGELYDFVAQGVCQDRLDL